MVDETMQSALMLFKRQHGHAAMRALLEEVAGVSAISQVVDSKVEAVIEACESDSKPNAKGGAKASVGPKPDFHSQAFVDHCHARFGGRSTRNE